MTRQHVGRRWLTLLALPLLWSLAGCAGGATSSTAGGVAPMPATIGKEAAPQDAGGSTVAPKVARTAAVTLVVDDATTAAASLRQTAATFGGSVLSENIATAASGEKGGASMPWSYSTIVISVPSDRLESALDAIAQLGTVTVRNVTATDVTTAVVDVDARLAVMRESIARVRALMERAGSLTEITALEAELTRRQADLESLVAQQKALANQVEKAPITISLIPRTEAPVATGSGFLAGLKAGWAAFLTTVSVVLTALGASAPFVVALALIVAILAAFWYAWRRSRSRRRRTPDPTSVEPATDAADSPEGDPSI